MSYATEAAAAELARILVAAWIVAAGAMAIAARAKRRWTVRARRAVEPRREGAAALAALLRDADPVPSSRGRAPSPDRFARERIVSRLAAAARMATATGTAAAARLAAAGMAATAGTAATTAAEGGRLAAYLGEDRFEASPPGSVPRRESGSFLRETEDALMDIEMEAR